MVGISESTQKIYNQLPEIYRKMDYSEGELTLLRYISALDKGGIEHLKNELLNLYDILSVQNAPVDIVPLIGRMLGFDYIEDLDERTQRKIVENISELYKRKGTKSVINFIAREFTEGHVQVIEVENRMFRTWSKESKLVPPSQRHITSRTFNGKRVNENTFYLISKNGKYSLDSVILLIESVIDLPLLNRLLMEFLPVTCKIYMQLMGVEHFEETMTLDTGRKESQHEFIGELESSPVNVSEDNEETHVTILDTEISLTGTQSKHTQNEKPHTDKMKAIVEEGKDYMKVHTLYKDTSKTISESDNPKYNMSFNADEEVINQPIQDSKDGDDNNEDIKAMVLHEDEGIDLSFEEELSNISMTLKTDDDSIDLDVDDEDLVFPPEMPSEED